MAFLLVTFSWVFSWLFRGPLLSRNTVFGPFSWLFRGPRFGQILRVLALEQSSENNHDSQRGDMIRGDGAQTCRFCPLSVTSSHGAGLRGICILI